MNLLEEYIAYLKDNPRGYWFKQKLYGIGWMPAKIQGWITLLIYLAFVLTIIVSVEAESEYQIIAPVVGATVVLLIIAWRTGEPLRWRWGRKNTNGK
ncbi:hypothetical protein KC926_04080 [Candidatus Kaiserbacteria bacterium]|nr:hypothetical protein [Candidatus Kaiserbacteria bacterium]